ncbi:biotin/lipoyl-binding protein [Roseateles sp. LYH14W]|uniref:Biotin/lipoyl-binding protein n=1 Tax=Pelomonas parva TaxID=3299032 RepID=A0ABW7FBZ7_9BURK
MSQRSTLSDDWYRVASLRPAVRAHARLHRHVYRGQVWYLLRDTVSNRTHRFARPAHQFIVAMDGQRTVQQLWERVSRQLGDAAPTQGEVVGLLGQLHAADLLLSDVPPDTLEVFERGEKEARAKRRRSWTNPLAIRIPLWDPDAWLERLAPLIRVVWSPWGALAWLVLVVPALLLVPPHWADLSNNFSDRVLGTDNLLLLWLVFPLIKALHELGHAFAIKRGGGQVHDMGVLLLVLVPVPYVEASSAIVFKSRTERALVGAAGMLVELALAAAAFLAWLVVEPGLVRALLFNVMLVAGVSTLVFNGNPLLRYDAYYILIDLVGIPNLAQRATRWWGWLLRRHAFGMRDAEAPRASRSEQAWFAFYGLASSLYRVLVAVGIALFVAGQFFFIGLLLAAWSLLSMVLLPLGKSMAYLASPALAGHRRRAWGVTAGAVAAVWLLLFVVPAPSRSVAEGVVWLPDESRVRAAKDGLVARVVAEPGSMVSAGDLLIEMRDPTLQAQLLQTQARVDELRAAWAARWREPAAALALREQLDREQGALDLLAQRDAELRVRANVDGRFVLANAADWPGRWARTGEQFGYVLGTREPAVRVVRVVVPQASVDQVRRATESVQLRLAHRPAEVVGSRILREVPQAQAYLPSAALAIEGGGRLATDPRDPQGNRTLERTFQFDVALPPASAWFGERVHVRFSHPMEPLGWQWARSARRLLLSQFQW